MTGPRNARAYLVIGIIAVLVIIIGFLSFQLFQERSDERATEEAIEVAEGFAARLTSISYDTYDEDTEAVLALATDRYRQQHETAADGDRLKEAMTETQARSTSTVEGVQAGAVTDDGIVITVDLTQTVTNINRESPGSKMLRLRLTLQRVDGMWKVDQANIAEF